MSKAIAAALACVVLAGCGDTGRPAAPRWSAAVCSREAGWIADRSLAVLRHFSGKVTVYPADVAYLALRNSLSRFEQYGCPRDVLGETLVRRLTPGQRTQLLEVVPHAMARSLRRAIAAA